MDKINRAKFALGIFSTPENAMSAVHVEGDWQHKFEDLWYLKPKRGWTNYSVRGIMLDMPL